MSSSPDPRRLDVTALAQREALLAGRAALADFPRLADVARAPQAGAPGAPVEVAWQVRGEHRRASDGARYPALHLRAEACLALTCQRCLGEVRVPLQVDRHFLFAPDETRAAALDETNEDDVLALEHAFDLHALVEDELLMALPLVPRHAQCPGAVPLSVQDPGFDAAMAEKAQPFAALAALKSGKSH